MPYKEEESRGDELDLDESTRSSLDSEGTLDGCGSIDEFFEPEDLSFTIGSVDSATDSSGYTHTQTQELLFGSNPRPSNDINPFGSNTNSIEKTPIEILEEQLKNITGEVRPAKLRRDFSAANSLVGLEAAIRLALNKLKKNKTSSQYDTFQTDCFAAIDRARPYLDPLDWKGVLGNLALAILGLGVVYAAAGLINLAVTGDFLFFRPKEKTNGLKEKINNITQEPDRSDSPDAENSLSA